MNSFLRNLVIISLLVVYVSGVYVAAFHGMTAEQAARWMDFLASPIGLAVNSGAFVTLSAFMFTTAYGLWKSPAHLRGGMNNRELVGWTLVPAWKALGIMVAFGVTYVNTPPHRTTITVEITDGSSRQFIVDDLCDGESAMLREIGAKWGDYAIPPR